MKVECLNGSAGKGIATKPALVLVFNTKLSYLFLLFVSIDNYRIYLGEHETIVWNGGGVQYKSYRKKQFLCPENKIWEFSIRDYFTCAVSTFQTSVCVLWLVYAAIMMTRSWEILYFYIAHCLSFWMTIGVDYGGGGLRGGYP